MTIYTCVVSGFVRNAYYGSIKLFTVTELLRVHQKVYCITGHDGNDYPHHAGCAVQWFVTSTGAVCSILQSWVPVPVITRQILDQMDPLAKLDAYEIDPYFVSLLNKFQDGRLGIFLTQQRN